MLYLAIDPGKEKTGTALLDTAGKVMAKSIIPSENIAEFVVTALKDRVIASILIGNTGSGAKIMQKIRSVAGTTEIVVIASTTRLRKQKKCIGWKIRLAAS